MRRILRLINEIPLGWMFTGLATVIFGFAGVYWLLGHFGAGLLEFTYETQREVTFGDALYFSLVTVSSLGYGDIRPIGWTRMFVGAEVIIGLGFFGLLVAKISSVKQDHILRELYYVDLMERRLGKYIDGLEEYRKLYRLTSNMLLDGDIDPELTTTFRSDVEETTLFYQVSALLGELIDLIKFEIRQGGFFGDVSDAWLSRIYAAVQSMMRHTAMLLERDPDQAYELILCDNEKRIHHLLDQAEELARLGKRYSRNRELVEQCDAIITLGQELQPSLKKLLSRSYLP